MFDDETGGRLVVQCVCGRSRRWTGYAGAIRDGWHASYVDGTTGHRRVWVCPGCFVPPAPPPERLEPVQIAEAVRGGVAYDVAYGDARWPSSAVTTRNLIARLCEIDPRRGKAYLEMVLEVVGPSRKASAAKWAAFVETQALEHGLDVTIPPCHQTIVHFAGALEWTNARGAVVIILAGWAACCSGERAKRIRANGEATSEACRVTCARCLKNMAKAFAQRWAREAVRRADIDLSARAAFTEQGRVELAHAVRAAEKTMPPWMRAELVAAVQHGPSPRFSEARYHVAERRWTAPRATPG
jgi:hypothetical protein